MIIFEKYGVLTSTYTHYIRECMVAELKESQNTSVPYYCQFVTDVLRFDTECLEKYETLLKRGVGNSQRPLFKNLPEDKFSSALVSAVARANCDRWARLGGALSKLGTHGNPFLISAMDEVRSVLKTIDLGEKVNVSTVISMSVLMFALDYGDTHWSDDFKEKSKFVRKQLKEADYLVGSDVAKILGFGLEASPEAVR